MAMGDLDLATLNKFLNKRDGIDKVLKVIRYTAKLVLADRKVESPFLLRIKSLESSLGTTRKALRLGKFLGNVQHLQTLAFNRDASTLAVISTTSEGIYYFIDQFVWSAPFLVALPGGSEDNLQLAAPQPQTQAVISDSFGRVPGSFWFWHVTKNS